MGFEEKNSTSTLAAYMNNTAMAPRIIPVPLPTNMLQNKNPPNTRLVVTPFIMAIPGNCQNSKLRIPIKIPRSGLKNTGGAG